MLDEVANFVLSFSKSHGCREFKELCENLIFTKVDIRFRNYEAFSFTAQFGQPQNFLFLVFFGSIFFCNIFLSEFPIKLTNDPSHSIHVLYKGRLQKKGSRVAEKNFSPL